MKNKFHRYIPLILIILLSVFLYFFKINNIPNGVYSDEATVGYNAFSILQTGKDEYGKSFPLAFRFFGAYTPPLYIYLIVPLIKFLGLNELSLRLLSGISTLFGIFVVYSLAKDLKIFKSSAVPFLLAFLFAICPWVVFNARLGYEVTLGYILFSLGAFFIWKGISQKSFSALGLLILSISTYAAHTERFLVPFFLIFVLFFYRKEVLSFIRSKKFPITLLLLVITQIPNFILLFTKAFWVKNNVFEGINIAGILTDFFSQYLTYISPSGLFGISKDINLQHTIPLLAPFYSWLIIPFFIGLYVLWTKRNSLSGKYIFILLVTSPIPGSLSGHFISIQRILPIIIPIFLVMGLGFDILIKKVSKYILVPALILLSLFSLLMLWRSYFIFLPKENATWWSYGYSQIANIVKQHPSQTFVFDNSRLPPAYMSFLYHLQYSPQEFQKQFSPEFVDSYYSNPPYNPNYKIANVDIRPIVWETDTLIDQILIGDTLAISEEQAKDHFLTKIIDVKDPLGNSIFIGYQTDPAKKIADNARKKALLLRSNTR
ncbi:MAG TPA: hypothetical protein PLI45_01895 [Candidatus Woesebacteria bacterium]|nr:hypothetical protein [Candidatus Woesebacteria bacterium]